MIYLITGLTILLVCFFIAWLIEWKDRRRIEEDFDLWISGHQQKNDYFMRKNRELRDRLEVAKNRPDLDYTQKRELFVLVGNEIKRLRRERKEVESTTIRTGHDVELVQTKLSDIDQMIDYYENIQSKLVD